MGGPLSSHRFAESTQLAEEFFELSPMGMAILRLEDPNNPAALRILALNPAAPVVSDAPTAIVGKRIDQDFPAIAQTPFPGQIAQVIRSGKAASLGEGPGTYDPTRQFTVIAFPIPPDCVGILFEDITERRKQPRRAHEADLRYRKIFEASTAAICIFDPRDTRLIDANRRFVELLGLGSPAQVTGKSLDSFGFWSGEGEYAELRGRLRTEHAIREMAVTFRTYGGQVRRALAALELFEVEGLECILGIFWRV